MKSFTRAVLLCAVLLALLAVAGCHGLERTTRMHALKHVLQMKQEPKAQDAALDAQDQAQVDAATAQDAVDPSGATAQDAADTPLTDAEEPVEQAVEGDDAEQPAAEEQAVEEQQPGGAEQEGEVVEQEQPVEQEGEVVEQEAEQPEVVEDAQPEAELQAPEEGEEGEQEVEYLTEEVEGPRKVVNNGKEVAEALKQEDSEKRKAVWEQIDTSHAKNLDSKDHKKAKETIAAVGDEADKRAEKFAKICNSKTCGEDGDKVEAEVPLVSSDK